MKRSKFSLSNYKLYTCDMGELVPVGLFEVLPGDTIQQSSNILLRASPMLAPVMHPVDVRIHHWYVPFRLIWDDFEKFITGGPDGMDASVFPTVTIGGGGAGVGGLGDYLGVATGVPMTTSVLPYRAYTMIWNEFYRDQDLETKLNLSTASGADSTTNLTMQNCDWEKDYFTSARPWEQKGPAITIPLGTTAPVKGIGLFGSDPSGKIDPNVANVRETAPLPDRTYPFGYNSIDPGQLIFETDADSSSAKPNIFADLSGASAVTVTVLREALALQRYEEARARFGSRYVEYLRYLGVHSSDARLQRPEYLGGGRNTIQFSEVLTTAAAGADPVGTMKGHGISAIRSNRYRRFIEEHGYVMTLASVRPKTMYFQGQARHWNRRLKEDFWQRELQHVGQQEILNKEIYAAHASPDGVFGYQDRYDEYRRQESTVAGDFRTTNLNFWHMARDFASSPALNATFVKCVPTERSFAVTTNDVLWCMAKHSIQARRLVSGSAQSFIY